MEAKKTSTTAAAAAAATPPQRQTREELPPHPITPAAAAYLATLTPQGKELHELATKMLGSSYFVERTHGFRRSAK